jgi:hypothetical protein
VKKVESDDDEYEGDEEEEEDESFEDALITSKRGWEWNERDWRSGGELSKRR